MLRLPFLTSYVLANSFRYDSPRLNGWQQEDATSAFGTYQLNGIGRGRKVIAVDGKVEDHCQLSIFKCSRVARAARAARRTSPGHDADAVPGGHIQDCRQRICADHPRVQERCPWITLV